MTIVQFEEQKTMLRQKADMACDAMMELKEAIMDMCEEGAMGQRDEGWYVRPERMGERRYGRMGHRGGMRDPYYY